MPYSFVSFRKSTIVRIVSIAAAAVLVSACGSLPRPIGAAAPCPPARTLVCDTFGSQSRCTCPETARVDRALDRLGSTALGLTAW